MRRALLAPAVVLLVLGWVSAPAAAVPAAASEAARTFVVGTKLAPPFALELDDGSWSGISLELWAAVAARLGIQYSIRTYPDVPALLAAVEHREVDVAVGALTITGEREARMDFSHPMYSTGLAIATVPSGNGGVLPIVRQLLSWQLVGLLAALVAVLAAIGGLVWLLERRRNPGQFGGGPVRGIGNGIWWSAATMTTVGYGDRSPVTFAGRVLGVVWMFAGIVLISSFTASITSSLTVSRLEAAIHGPDELVRVRTASVAGSTSASYLDRRHISFQPVATPLDGLRAVAAGEVDAMVYDAPILKDLVRRELSGAVVVLPATFEHQDYGFALPDGSPLREQINRALLDELGGAAWREILDRYLGPD